MAFDLNIRHSGLYRTVGSRSQKENVAKVMTAFPFRSLFAFSGKTVIADY